MSRVHLTTTTAIILAAIIPVATSALATYVASRTRKNQEAARANSDALKPYREAYEGATAINRQLNEGLRSEIERLRRRTTELERQVVEHQATIERLMLVLHQHNIDLPP